MWSIIHICWIHIYTMLPVAAAMAHIESLIVAFASHLCKGYVGGGNVCAKAIPLKLIDSSLLLHAK